LPGHRKTQCLPQNQALAYEDIAEDSLPSDLLIEQRSLKQTQKVKEKGAQIPPKYFFSQQKTKQILDFAQEMLRADQVTEH
jgi:hypothetical protein